MAAGALKPYSYFGTGGQAAHLFVPKTLSKLEQALRFIHQNNLPSFFVGAGSNTLIMDDDWSGAAICFAELDEIRLQDGVLSVQAGCVNQSLVEYCYENSLSGLEWMCRLPGQLGATVRMNARCYGGEISQVVTKIMTFDASGQRHEYTDMPAVFKGYKDTIFMSNGEAVAEVEFRLIKGDQLVMKQAMNHCEQDRQDKMQFDYPSCGCVFKNSYDVGVPSGMLLDAAKVRDLSRANLTVSPKHANFVFNKGASSREILELTLAMRQRVYEAFGVWLSYEMEILGSIPKDLATQLAENRPQKFNQQQLAPLRQQFKERL